MFNTTHNFGLKSVELPVHVFFSLEVVGLHSLEYSWKMVFHFAQREFHFFSGDETHFFRILVYLFNDFLEKVVLVFDFLYHFFTDGMKSSTELLINNMLISFILLDSLL